MRFLVVADAIAPEAGARSWARLGRTLRLLRASGHRALVVRGLAAGEPAAPLDGAEDLVDLDLGRFEGRVALEGVLRESGAEALVASGAIAALGVGQIECDLPLWLDLPSDLETVLRRPVLPIEGDAETGAWHRWLWALERADLVSAAGEGALEFVRGGLAVRGRLRAAGGPELIAWTGEHEAPGPLAAWLASPRRAASTPRVLGRSEIADLSDLARAAREADRPADLCRRLRALVARGRRGARSGARALNVAAATALLVPLLALTAGARWLLARLGPGSASEPFRHGPDAAARTALRERLGRLPRLLVVMPYRLHPPRHGGAVRLLALLERIVHEAEVHLLLFDQHGRSEWQAQALERLCTRVTVHHWAPDVRSSPWSLSPPGARLFASEALCVRIRDLIESEGIDVVDLENSELAGLRRAVGRVPTILVATELAYRSIARRRRLAGGLGDEVSRHYGATLLDQLRMYLYETRWAERMAEVHVMSELEGRALSRHLRSGARRLRVVPNGVDVARFRPPTPNVDRRGVLVSGNFAHAQNVDGAAWFLAQVWPKVRAADPAAKLTLAGAEMPPALAAAGGRDGVEVVGEVADIAAVYRQHRVLAVPIRAGAGTRLKIAEAFAAGTAVVSTPIGAEGLAVEDGRELRVARGAAAFAEAVVELLANDAERARLADAARVRAEEMDWSRSAEALLGAVYAPLAVAAASSRRAARRVDPPGAEPVGISVVLPIRRGGELLERVIERVRAQRTARGVEVICVDSGTPPDQLERLAALGVRRVEIAPGDFDHGLSRDLGASVAAGEILVFLNQDALPVDDRWLERLVEPLFGAAPPAAVQGGIREFPDASPLARRFFWESCGPRFYFTSESAEWIRRHGGLGFSTVNAAIRKEVWRRVRFGWAPILEDKKWQAEVTRRGWRIAERADAMVYHSHDYDLTALWRRCAAEGMGWRLVGERYGAGAALRDIRRAPGWRELRARFGERAARRPAAFLFPALRPLALWWGNRTALSSLAPW